MLDFVFAYAFGIVFQYYAIMPRGGLSPGQGLVATVKADTASLISWQVSMYGFMDLAQLYLFPHLVGDQAPVNSVEFWFATQSMFARAVPQLNVMLTSYFGGLGDNAGTALSLPVAGLHLDLVRAPDQLESILSQAPRGLVLSLGVIDGRNV